jgi:hypothetical protein
MGRFTLKILRYDAGLNVAQDGNCSAIGSDVQVIVS